MPLMFFPDNTVLINFGIIDRFDILLRLTNGNGRWCASVANECYDSSAYVPAITQSWDVFGKPIRPEGREVTDARILRNMLADPNDPDDHDEKHLGEAETITIVVTRGWASDSYFLTDDNEAAARARADGIKVFTTNQILQLASRMKILEDDDAWNAIQKLQAKNRRRHPCPPCSKGKNAFLTWLKS